MALHKETFRKHERLCSKRAIDSLFENGITVFSSPFQIVWTWGTPDLLTPARAAISISKKLFRSAVKRNTIKRKIREAYRKNKHILYDFLKSENKNIVFMIIYKNNEIQSYAETEAALQEAIRKLIISVESASETATAKC